MELNQDIKDFITGRIKLLNSQLRGVMYKVAREENEELISITFNNILEVIGPQIYSMGVNDTIDAKFKEEIKASMEDE